MTAPLSTGNRRFCTYFFYRLRSMKDRVVMLSIMAACSFPLMAVCADIFALIGLEDRRGAVLPETVDEMNARHSIMNSLATLLALSAAVMILIVFIQGHLTAKKSFRRLSERKYTDMDMSLPTDADIRFFGDMLAGLLVYIIPVAASVILTQLILIPGHSFAEQYRELRRQSGMGFGGSFVQLTQIVSIVFLIACIMQYFMSLMLVSLCGRRLTANILPVIFNIALPVVIYFLGVITGAFAYGIVSAEFAGEWQNDFSPLGMIINSLWRSPEITASMLCGELELRALLFCAVCGTAAYFLIKHRREERTGNAFVYKGGRYVTELMIMLTSAAPVFISLHRGSGIQNALSGIAGFAYNLLKIPPVILFTVWLCINLIIFVIIELVCREKLTKPLRLLYSAGRFAVSAGLSFLICFIFSECDAFGASSYIPAVNDIDHVGITVVFRSLNNIDNYAEIRTQEQLEKVTVFHRRIVDERPETSTLLHGPYIGMYDSGNPTAQISFTYELNDGSRVRRMYYLPKEYSEDLLGFWFDSGAFASAYKLGMPTERNTVDLSATVYDRPDGSERKIYATLAYEDIREALEKDASAADWKELFMRGGAQCRKITVTTDNAVKYLYIWDTFENTRALLHEQNFELFADVMPPDAEYSLFRRSSVGYFTADLSDEREKTEFRIITPEQGEELLSHSSGSAVYAESRDVYCIEVTSTYRNIPIYFVAEDSCDRAAEIYNGMSAG